MKNKLFALLFGASLLFSVFVLPTFFEQKSTDALAIAMLSRTNPQIKKMIGDCYKALAINARANPRFASDLTKVDKLLCDYDAVAAKITTISTQKYRTTAMFIDLYPQKQAFCNAVLRRDSSERLIETFKRYHIFDINIDTTLANKPVEVQNTALQAMQVDLSFATLKGMEFYLDKYCSRIDFYYSPEYVVLPYAKLLVYQDESLNGGFRFVKSNLPNVRDTVWVNNKRLESRRGFSRYISKATAIGEQPLRIKAHHYDRETGVTTVLRDTFSYEVKQ